ncbi:hypothetical protein PanWU01x14_243550 [Parasponia andersonii]|uniref:Uncharacterized protein n=1 Tax=Parasponia andersonii TaxID=3476 RepID=A0A2P5BFR3_PARAD|nr:hypothetical protein PanWU01x14_243550 [Parasponia andersonii]
MPGISLHSLNCEEKQRITCAILTVAKLPISSFAARESPPIKIKDKFERFILKIGSKRVTPNCIQLDFDPQKMHLGGIGDDEKDPAIR